MRRLVLVSFLALPCLAAAQEPLPVDPAVTIGELSNGLRYYIRENRRPEKRAELRLVVNAGSVLEDPDQLGLAHFVEHMAFNGTTHFQGQEMVDFLERIGMRFGPHLNASTSFDETVYTLRLPTDSAELLAMGFQILEDWAHGITFDPTEIEKERGVVIEEWRGRRGAGARLADQVNPVLFRGSRYAERLPIGTRESLETFAPEALVRFYRDWYRPDLMAVIAVGDFDGREVERLIRSHFARIPAREVTGLWIWDRPNFEGKVVHVPIPARQASVAEPIPGLRLYDRPDFNTTAASESARPRPEYALARRDEPAAMIATDREATGTQIQLHFFRPAGERGTVSAYRASLVSGLYTRMLNERLSELARKPNPPFRGASASIGMVVRSTERFSLGAAVPDTGVQRGLEAVLIEVERVERHGFTAAELERAKRNLLRAGERAYAERDNFESAQLAPQYIRHFLMDHPIPGIAAQLELVQRLLPDMTLEDVNRAAHDWLRLEDRVVVVNAPEKPDVTLPAGDSLLELVERVRQSEIGVYEETVSDALLLDAELPATPIVNESHDSVLNTTAWTLANGVRVILKPTDFKADEVLFTAHSPGGMSLVADSLFTSAEVTTQVMNASGLGEFSAVELQRKLAGIVAQAEPYIGAYYDGLSGGASPGDLKTLFELIYLRFTAARADTAAFQALQSNFRTALSNRTASPEAAFQDTLQAVLSQHHPRTRPFTVARVDSIDLTHATTIYRDRFADASDFTFVFVGNIDADRVRPLVRRYLGNLPALRRGEEPRDVGIRLPSDIVEREVRKGIEPKSQTRLVFSGPVEYNRAERLALLVLGEVLQTRLREQLREELGGTYSVSVRGSATRVPDQPYYTVSVAFGSAPENVDDLVAEVFAQVDSLRRHGAGEPELAKVKEAMRRQQETGLKENKFWLNLLAATDRRGEDPHEALDLDADLKEISTESLRMTAEKYLDPKRFVRVTLMPE